jgi:hypothetical protein
MLFAMGKHQKEPRKHGQERGSVKDHKRTKFVLQKNVARDDMQHLYQVLDTLMKANDVEMIKDACMMAEGVVKIATTLYSLMLDKPETKGAEPLLAQEFVQIFSKLSPAVFKNISALFVLLLSPTLSSDRLVNKEAQEFAAAFLNGNKQPKVPHFLSFIKQYHSGITESEGQAIFGFKLFEAILWKYNALSEVQKRNARTAIDIFAANIKTFTHVLRRAYDIAEQRAEQHRAVERAHMAGEPIPPSPDPEGALEPLQRDFAAAVEKIRVIFDALARINQFAAKATHGLILSILNFMASHQLEHLTIQRDVNDAPDKTYNDEEILLRKLVIWNPINPTHAFPPRLIPNMLPTYEDFLAKQAMERAKVQVKAHQQALQERELIEGFKEISVSGSAAAAP